MLDNCCYDKCKLLYKFSRIAHFIKKHGKDDAKNDPEFLQFLIELEKDVEGHIDQLNAMLCKKC